MGIRKWLFSVLTQEGNLDLAGLATSSRKRQVKVARVMLTALATMLPSVSGTAGRHSGPFPLENPLWIPCSYKVSNMNFHVKGIFVLMVR